MLLTYTTNILPYFVHGSIYHNKNIRQYIVLCGKNNTLKNQKIGTKQQKEIKQCTKDLEQYTKYNVHTIKPIQLCNVLKASPEQYQKNILKYLIELENLRILWTYKWQNKKTILKKINDLIKIFTKHKNNLSSQSAQMLQKHLEKQTLSHSIILLNALLNLTKITTYILTKAPFQPIILFCDTCTHIDKLAELLTMVGYHNIIKSQTKQELNVTQLFEHLEKRITLFHN
jgi:hypothetical protein